MKKIIYLSFITFSVLFISLINFKVDASNFTTEYQSYPEIIMQTGKLARDYTDSEYSEYISSTESHFWMFGIDINVVNKSVSSTYISDVLYSYTNNSATDITYTIEIQRETKKTSSFSTSGSVSGGIGGNTKKIKAEVSAKADIDYKLTEVESEKVTEKYDVTIEAHSNIIVFLEGHLLITNGVITIYTFFFKTSGKFELAILQDQNIRVEKSSI